MSKQGIRRVSSRVRWLGFRFAMVAPIAGVVIACSVERGDEAPATGDTPAARDTARDPENTPSAGEKTMNVRVVDGSTHQGLAGMALAVVASDGSRSREVTTGPSGAASLRVPASGRVSIVGTKRGYSMLLSGVKDGDIPSGEVVFALDPLQAVTSDRSSAPGNAKVDEEIGRSVIPTAGSDRVTLFYAQGPNVNADHYAVPLFGAPNQTYQVAEFDAATLKPLTQRARLAQASKGGALVLELSPESRPSVGHAGVIVALTTLQEELRDPPVALATAASPGSQGVAGFPDSCGPKGAACLQKTITTGNVQEFCPPAEDPPYCSVSFSASVGATVGVKPFGIGVDLTGTATVGAGINVYPVGTGTFECKVKATACAWKQPGHYEETEGWGMCLIPYTLTFYPCWKTIRTWVPDPCGGGGIQPEYPNLGLSNGFCTCFSWSAVMQKIKECPRDGGADAEAGSR